MSSNLSFGSGFLAVLFKIPPDPRRLPFGPGRCPYPAGYTRSRKITPCFPLAFRPTGIRFLDHPVPAEDSSSLCSRLAVRRQTSTGFPRSTRPRYDWIGCLHYPGSGGVRASRQTPQGSPVAFQRRDLSTAPAFRRRSLKMTGHSQRFTCVHPLSLPLACCLRTERRLLSLKTRLHTPPLPATHAGLGIDLDTGREEFALSCNSFPCVFPH